MKDIRENCFTALHQCMFLYYTSPMSTRASSLTKRMLWVHQSRGPTSRIVYTGLVNAHSVET